MFSWCDFTIVLPVSVGPLETSQRSSEEHDEHEARDVSSPDVRFLSLISNLTCQF